jgi:hypothetical protein
MDNPFAAIGKYRPSADSHVWFVERSFSSPVDAAAEFGLRPDERAFSEVSRERAVAILRFVLRYDLSCGSDVMTADQAQRAIESIMAMLPADTRFYTNGDWDRRSTIGERHVASGTSWVPATDCTIDGGIMALGGDCAACVWFGDED